MQRFGIDTLVIGLAIVFGVSVFAIAPVSADAAISEANAPVRVAMSEEGPIFVTKAGMSLYTFPPDGNTPGKSQCTLVPKTSIPDPTAGFGKFPLPRAEHQKSCAQKWPPLLADDNAQAGDDWSLIDRPEGGKQWAYQGRPVYTSIKDKKPGDLNGYIHVGQIYQRFTPVKAPLHFPPGLTILRRGEALLIATENDRPVFTRSGARVHKVCAGCEELLEPISAPAIAKVDGDWSIIDDGLGNRQYAFRGKPLFAAPASHTNTELEETGEWETVVYQEGAGLPSAIEHRHTLLGDVYTDKDGLTLYLFTCVASYARDGVRCDDPGDAAAYWSALCGDAEECARRWRPYPAEPGAQDVGDWSVIDAAYPVFEDRHGITYPPGGPRIKAWAYRGHPVYRFHLDEAPGDIWGHSLRWFSFSGFYALTVPGRGRDD